MKFVFKRASKKALSGILALAIILCSISAVFSVFANTETETAKIYTIEEASPAIPMFAGKVVNFKDIEIAFSDTVTVGGADVKWALNTEVTDDDNVILMSDCIYATSAGKTCLTATYGEGESAKTQNIWVIVNEQTNTDSDYDFYLVNLDLTTTGGDYNAADWVLQLDSASSTTNYGNGTETATISSYSGKASATVSSVTDSEGASHDNDAYATSYNRFMPAVSKDGITLTTYNTGSATLLYKSEMLKDFADYTISANVKNGNNEAVARTYFSVVARATVNEAMPTVAEAIVETEKITNSSGSSQTLYTFADGLREQINGVSVFDTSSTALRLITHRYGALAINAMESTGRVLGTDVYDTFYTNPAVSYENQETTSTSANTLNGTGYVAADSDYAWGLNSFKTLKYTLDGNRIVYNLKNADATEYTEIFDSAKIADSIQGVDIRYSDLNGNRESYISEITDLPTADDYAALTENLGKGTVGFSITRTPGIYIKSLQVSLNVNSIDDLPVMTAPDFYTVTDTDPVIPMIAGYKLSTSDLMMSVNGVNYPASAFSWTGGSNTTAEIKDGYLYSYSKGGTVLNGTLTANSDITAKLYVVAKESGDAEYTVYSNDYRSTINETSVSDWKTTIVNNSDVDTEIAVSGNKAVEQNLKGFVPYNYDTIKTNSNLTVTYGTDANRAYTLLDNEIVSSLTDYKITASFRMYTGTRGAIGVLGRVSNTTDGKYIAGSSKTYGFATGKGYTAKFNDVHTISANTLAASSDASAALKNYLQASITSNGYEYRTFVIEFKDATATLSAPGIEGTATLTAPEQAGQVGFVAMFSRNDAATTPVLMDFAVNLTNVNDEAVAAKLVSNDTEVVKKAGGYVDNGNYYFKTEEGKNYLEYANSDASRGYYITDTTKPYSEKIVIPSTNVEGYDGLVIDTGWGLIGVKSLEIRSPIGEIVLSDGYQKIGGHSFKNMPNLEKVTVPEALTSIADTAFNTSGLTEIILPDTFKTISFSVFANCRSLRKVELGNSITSIGNTAFQNCTVLQEIVLPASCESIGDNAFAGDIMLKEVYVYNPEMTFGTTAVPATATIYGFAGSSAEDYAEANGNEFVALDMEHTVSLNSKSYLPSTLYGKAVVWPESVVNEYFEIYNTGVIVALKEGSVIVDCTVTYNGVENATPVTIKVDAYDTEAYSHIVATDKATIAATGTDGEYTVTFSDDLFVKYDTFTINNSANIAVNEQKADTTATGKTFVFKVADYGAENLQNIKIKFETTDEATNSGTVYALGASTKEFANGTYGLRFTSRIPAISYSKTEENVAYGAFSSAIIGNETVTPLAVGALLMPEALLGTNELTLTDAQVENIILGNAVDEIEIGRYFATNVVIDKLSDITEIYADYSVLLTSMPAEMLEVPVTYRNYIIYKNQNGDYAVKYEEAISRDYSEVNTQLNTPVQPLNVVSEAVKPDAFINGTDNVVISWGDSITQSTVGNSYPSQLMQNLGGQYLVYNAGDAGETATAILSRANQEVIRLQYSITFEAGEEYSATFSRGILPEGGNSSSSSAYTNCWVVDENGKNVYYTTNGNQLPIATVEGQESNGANVVIDGVKYELIETKDGTQNPWGHYSTFKLKRTGDTSKELTLAAGTQVTYDYSAYYTKADVGIVLYGANGYYFDAYNNDATKKQALISQFKQMSATADNMLYIIPYFWSIDLTPEFVEAFGEDANKLIHIREYLRDDAFEDYDIIPTEKDLYYINEKNLTPYCFMATQPTDNSYDCHMSQLGYKILADLIYKQGVELGYWK